MTVINPFEIEGEASRYHTFRPRYHHIPLGLVREYIGRDFDTSLDVACGTGHSTQALSKISKKTFGCDLSESMLKEARESLECEFLLSPAEKLPFSDKTFDFVTTSMGFHWFEQEKFLGEAKRVLKQEGYIAIDNYGYRGKISDDPIKQKADQELFKNYLPPASRRPGYPTEELMKATGLHFVNEFSYNHKVNLNSHEFANLIMTWSNFQVLAEETKSATAQKMKETYDMIFEGQSLDLDFGGKIILYNFGET